MIPRERQAIMFDLKRCAAMVLMAAALWPAAVHAQSWKEVTMSRQLEGTAPVRARVAYGAGRFSLSSTSEPLLYRMSIRYDEDKFEPRAELSGDRLIIGVESTGRGFSLNRSNGEGSMELELARGVPMDLDLEFGAVRADVDLGGLSLTDLELSTGASESVIDISEVNPSRMRRAEFHVGAADFTLNGLGNLGAESVSLEAGVGQVTLGLDGAWPTDAELEIDMGLGALELRVPEGLGVRIRKESFLTSFDSEGLVKRGDAYYSLDWEEADRKITIDLNAAFGAVQVVWIR